MIWSGPHVKAAPGTRIQTPVSLLDIFPTLAALNGGRGPGNAKACGISLAASLQAGSEPPERTLYMETERKSDAVLYLAMRDGAWKYTTRTGTDGLVLNILVDMYRDPAEETNLVEVQSGLAARFGESLQTWNRENPPREAERTQTHLDENRLREMRSLGYLK
jgi:arylsulfatase A-like enzyme